MKIVHVLPTLSWGGGARSTLDLGRAQPDAAEWILISLRPADAPFVQAARAVGFRVIQNDAPESARAALENADIVHVHFWNTPEMYAWLRSPLPAMRLVMTLHVAGEFPAQIFSSPLLDFPDYLVPTSTYSTRLPEFRAWDRANVRVITASSRMPDKEIVRPPHAGIRVGYAGTVDFIKMHARFIEICAAVQDPRVTFPVVGGGDGFKTLQKQARALGIQDKFEWLGYRADIFETLATFNILGYPLCRESYASCEAIVQEAMWLDVPPVVLDHGALPDLIQNGETGIVARDEHAYTRAIDHLCADETERQRLGENARAYARQHFGADKYARELGAVYDQVMRNEKRERVWRGAFPSETFRGASALIESFGAGAAPYLVSLESENAEEHARAENRIAHAPPVESKAGGVFEYRVAYPHDAMLRFWTGLILGQQGRYALAAGELRAAQNLGLPEARVKNYFARVMKHQPPFANGLGKRING